MNESARKASQDFSVNTLAKALFIVNRHAKTATD